MSIVIARATVGWHPEYGDIIAGKEYDRRPGDLPPDLFIDPPAAEPSAPPDEEPQP